MSNYDEAKKEADLIDQNIIDTLCKGKNFRVEAGAGSGKTYSLMKVIQWLQDNKWEEYKKTGKKVACLTYTNAAVDVIESRLKENSFITPMTIHSFAWSSIKQFQNKIIELMDSQKLIPDKIIKDDIQQIDYSLGVKYFENGKLYLNHNDVIKLFSSLLDNGKFRNILAKNYPVILIDEYQDSNKNIMDKFITYFISENKGIQFGLFGDSWQTIYQTNNACGFVEHENLVPIRKTVNFRSAENIVEFLNKIRPVFKQRTAVDDYPGSVTIITNNDFTGVRRDDRNFKGDLPAEVLEERLNVVKDICEKEKEEDENLKVLMITHRVLAEQQGYENVLSLLGDGFKNGDDPLLLFFKDVIEPAINAISNSDVLALCDVLKVKRYPITKKSDKRIWNELKEKISNARSKTLFDVLSIIKNSSVIPFSDKVEVLYKKMVENSEEEYQNGTIADIKNVKYSEFENAIEFIQPDAIFSTEHGVKGEEYSTVIFVVSKGWNQYQFDTYMPMGSRTAIPTENISSYERNRNLFYVCCSRPQKKLIIFVTIELQGEFKKYLENIAGIENITTYSDYTAKKN
ncbi:MAG: AAA family ATPase [Treponema sp.]|nr:AAA family ATPase [Treponema sp.]